MATVKDYTERFKKDTGRRPSAKEGVDLIRQAFRDKFGRSPNRKEDEAIRQRAHTEFPVEPPRPAPKPAPKKTPVKAAPAKPVNTSFSGDPRNLGLPAPQLMRQPSAPAPKPSYATAGQKPFPKAKYTPKKGDVTRATPKPAPKPQPSVGPRTPSAKGYTDWAITAQNAWNELKEFGRSEGALLDTTVAPFLAYTSRPGSPLANPQVHANASRIAQNPDPENIGGTAAMMNTMAVGAPALEMASPLAATVAGLGFVPQGVKGIYDSITGKAPSFQQAPVSTGMNAAMALGPLGLIPRLPRQFNAAKAGLKDGIGIGPKAVREFSPARPVAEPAPVPHALNPTEPVLPPVEGYNPAPKMDPATKALAEAAETGTTPRKAPRKRTIKAGVNKAQEPPVVQATAEQAAPKQTAPLIRDVTPNDVILSARNEHAANGTGRHGALDWTIDADGKTVVAAHSITGREFGTIDLETGKILPTKPGDRAPLEALYNGIRQRAEEGLARQELSRLIQHTRPEELAKAKALADKYPNIAKELKQEDGLRETSILERAIGRDVDAPPPTEAAAPVAPQVEAPAATGGQTVQPATPEPVPVDTPLSTVEQTATNGKGKAARPRTTPAKGTPEREALDAASSKADRAQRDAFDAYYDAKREAEQATAGSKRKAQLEKKVEALEKAYREASEAEKQPRESAWRAQLEDQAESADEAVRLFAEGRLDGDIDGYGLASTPRGREVIGRIREIAQEEINKQGITDADEINFILSRVVDTTATSVHEKPMPERVKSWLPDVNRVRIQKEIDALPNLTPNEKSGFKSKVEDTFIDNRDSVLEQAKARDAEKAAQKQQAEQSEMESVQERSRKVRPVEELRYKPSAFDGNMAEPGPWITDTHMGFDTEAVKPKQKAAVAKLADAPDKSGRGRGVAQQTIQEKIIGKALKDKGRKDAEILGAIPEQGNIAYIAEADGNVVTADGNFLRFIAQHVDFDRITTAGNEKPILFYRGNKPVAILMPRRYDTNVMVDVGVVRETLGLSAPKTKATPKKGAPVKGKAVGTVAFKGKAALPTSQGKAGAGIVRASDIVADLDKAFAPIRSGRIRQHRASGIFKVKPSVIRTRIVNDLPTIAHETGHALHKILWPDRLTPRGNLAADAFPREFWKELKPLDYDPSKARVQEGYAEFMRLWLTDPAQAQAKAPKFNAFFEGVLAQHPEVKATLAKAQADIKAFIDQPAAAKVRSTISYEHRPDRPTAGEVYRSAYQALVDELDPLRRAEEAITGGEPIPSRKSAFKEAWRGRGLSGKMEEWLFHGVTDKNGKKVAASLSERLKPVQGELTEWQDYAVARHALDVIDSGRTMPLPRETYQAVVDAAPPHYQKVLESVVEYQDHVLEELVRSGMLSRQAKNKMRQDWPNHVPLYRDMAKDGPKGTGRKYADLKNPIKRLKGSGRDILPPVENIVKDTYAMLAVAQRNRVMLKLADLAERFHDSGRIVERVPAKMKPTSVTLADLLQGDPHNLGSEAGAASAAGLDLDAARVIFKPNVTGSVSENIVAVYRDGKPELYQLDPALFEAVTAADTVSLGVLEKIMWPATTAAKTLRAGATLAPEFPLRNKMRDVMTALVFSEYGLSPIDLTRGLFHTIKRTDLYHQFKASGAAHANLVSLDRDYLGQSVKRLMANPSPSSHVLDFVKHPIEALRALSEVMEDSTRLAEFGKGTKWGAETNPSTVIDAVLATRDMGIDFSRAGKAGKHINRITAFFNAAVGGADKTARVFKEHPVRSTTRAMAYITAPTVALYLINRDDKRYRDLPDWEKDMFWHIPTPNNGPLIRVPRPFELGVAFAAFPERVMRWIDEQDPHALDGFGETLKGQLPELLPTLLVPAWQIHGNKSFTGAPIVPRSEQDLPPQLQAGPDTTAAARGIGKALKTSPRKVDYAIRGYTGGLGRMVNEGIVDPAVSMATGKKKIKPSKRFSEAPGAKAFFVSPFASSRSTEQLYDERKKLSDKKALGTLAPQERRRLDRLDDGAKTLSDLRKQDRAVRSESDPAALNGLAMRLGVYSPSASPSETKRAALLEIKRRMNEAADKTIAQ